MLSRHEHSALRALRNFRLTRKQSTVPAPEKNRSWLESHSSEFPLISRTSVCHLCRSSRLGADNLFKSGSRPGFIGSETRTCSYSSYSVTKPVLSTSSSVGVQPEPSPSTAGFGLLSKKEKRNNHPETVELFFARSFTGPGGKGKTAEQLIRQLAGNKASARRTFRSLAGSTFSEEILPFRRTMASQNTTPTGDHSQPATAPPDDLGPMGKSIYTKIATHFNILESSHLDIEDESHMHRGHAGVRDANTPETHFNVTCISDKFQGKSRVLRHKAIYALLGEEFEQGLHALSLNLKTPKEAGVEK